MENEVIECGGAWGEDVEGGCDGRSEFGGMEAMGGADEGVVERKKGCGGGE